MSQTIHIGPRHEAAILKAVNKYARYVKRNWNLEKARSDDVVINIINKYSREVGKNWNIETKRLIQDIKKYSLQRLDPLLASANFIDFSLFKYYEPQWTQWLTYSAVGRARDRRSMLRESLARRLTALLDGRRA